MFKIENNLGDLKWNQWLGIILFLYIFYLIMLGAMGGGSPASSNSESTSSSFSSEARTRFDDILSVIPELSSISCEGGDCSSVVYFDFKTIPYDIDTLIRGNTATFSKFKLEKTGVSHVTIMARYNGNVLKKCNASGGIVDSCN
jgi:hypothetical protein